MTHWLMSAASLSVVVVASVTDLRAGRIPNWLTLPTMLAGVIGNSVVWGVAGASESLIGLIVCVLVPGVVYQTSRGQGIGGGDIKLFAGLGALLGPMQGLEVELSSFLLVALFAMFRLAFLGQLGRTLHRAFLVAAGLFIRRLRDKVSESHVPMTTMRMGPAIAVAVATVLALPRILRWLPWLG
ncbi:MAG TPA: A24 family peptidase [Polyangiaceae bacterium]